MKFKMDSLGQKEVPSMLQADHNLSQQLMQLDEKTASISQLPW